MNRPAISPAASPLDPAPTLAINCLNPVDNLSRNGIIEILNSRNPSSGCKLTGVGDTSIVSKADGKIAPPLSGPIEIDLAVTICRNLGRRKSGRQVPKETLPHLLRG